MKTKWAIFGGLTVVGAGIWYLFFREQFSDKESSLDPVGPIEHEKGHDHIRKVIHTAKIKVASPEAI